MRIRQWCFGRSTACRMRLTHAAVTAMLSIVCAAGACAARPDASEGETAAASLQESAAAESSDTRPCPPGPVANYLEPEAQQCWYTAANGRWRTLSHDLHYDTLVVQTEADDIRDADEILRRFVEVHRERFSEVLVYVHPVDESPPVQVRRARWTESGGYDTLDFERA